MAYEEYSQAAVDLHIHDPSETKKREEMHMAENSPSAASAASWSANRSILSRQDPTDLPMRTDPVGTARTMDKLRRALAPISLGLAGMSN